jgi:molecular chaperone GrpE (heat shock protein)
MREMLTDADDVFHYADDIIDEIDRKDAEIADLRKEIERKDAEITRLRLRILFSDLMGSYPLPILPAATHQT